MRAWSTSGRSIREWRVRAKIVQGRAGDKLNGLDNLVCEIEISDDERVRCVERSSDCSGEPSGESFVGALISIRM